MGKSSAPAAPDYVGQAQAQSAGNLNAARSQTAANRINQVTPYGSIKYTQGNGQFDQGGYDAAMAAYNKQQSDIRNNPALGSYYKEAKQMIAAPNRNDYMGAPDQWSSEIQLSDTGQQLLDAYNRTSLGMADLQGGAMDRVRDTLSQPFDMSGLQDMTTDNSDLVNRYNDYVKGLSSETGMDAWNKATDLVRQRQNPELDRQQAALDAKLANQGLAAGSEGWGIQQQNFGKTRNDADIAAQMAGLQAQNQFFNQATQKAGLLGTGVGYGFQNAGLNNSARQQQLTERARLRQMPLDELNALRSGAQVTNPTFNMPGQQGQTAGPDLLGATSGQYNAQMGQVNAENAQAAGQTQAGVGLLAAAASFY